MYPSNAKKYQKNAGWKNWRSAFAVELTVAVVADFCCYNSRGKIGLMLGETAVVPFVRGDRRVVLKAIPFSDFAEAPDPVYELANKVAAILVMDHCADALGGAVSDLKNWKPLNAIPAL